MRHRRKLEAVAWAYLGLVILLVGVGVLNPVLVILGGLVCGLGLAASR